MGTLEKIINYSYNCQIHNINDIIHIHYYTQVHGCQVHHSWKPDFKNNKHFNKRNSDKNNVMTIMLSIPWKKVFKYFSNTVMLYCFVSTKCEIIFFLAKLLNETDSDSLETENTIEQSKCFHFQFNFKCSHYFLHVNIYLFDTLLILDLVWG